MKKNMPESTHGCTNVKNYFYLLLGTEDNEIHLFFALLIVIFVEIANKTWENIWDFI